MKSEMPEHFQNRGPTRSAANDQWLCDVTHPGEPCPADRPAAYAVRLRWERLRLAVSETWLRLRGVKGLP